MRIVLGVTGSIAAYKAAELLRELQRRGHEVRVVMTEAAQAFVRPLTFETLSGARAALHGLNQPQEWSVEHIGLARWGDALAIAPATADVLARMAHGLAPDFLTTLYLAFEGKIFAAPAMNPSMWAHPAVRENVAVLKKRGVLFIEPEAGEMACGEEGAGRMAAPAQIAAALEHACASGALAGKRVLVSAGATQEPLDAARHLSSPSTGRMGFALAEAAFRRGAEVTLVAGPTPLETPWGVERADVRTVEEMHAALKARFSDCDILAMSAAVSDLRPAKAQKGKTKKDALPSSIALALTMDILKNLSASAGKKRPFLLGFAAGEARNLRAEGERKLREKNLDALFANPIDARGAGFASAENEGILLFADKWKREPMNMPRASKAEVAGKIWDEVEAALGGTMK